MKHVALLEFPNIDKLNAFQAAAELIGCQIEAYTLNGLMTFKQVELAKEYSGKKIFREQGSAQQNFN